jgi:hypothetical protein
MTEGVEPSASSAVALGATQVAFIDGALEGRRTLVHDIQPGAQVGAGVSGLTAIHIFSHGEAGRLTFGGDDSIANCERLSSRLAFNSPADDPTADGACSIRMLAAIAIDRSSTW